MTKKIKGLALLLALLTVLSAFAACGGGTETEPDVSGAETDEATDPATEADTDPETDPETKEETQIETKPETDADTEPETDAETEAPSDALDPSDVSFVFDFETEKDAVSYFTASEVLGVNHSLNGFDIKDGKMVYNQKCIALQDKMNFFEWKKFSVEFDFCFNAFVNKDNTSVLTLITDDDGVLNGQSSFYMAFKMDMNGVIYHNHAKNLSFQVEQGKTHHYKLEIDTENKKAWVYVDGSLLVSTSYNQSLNNYNCVRIMDNSRGADMWVDNLVLTNLEAEQNKSTDRLARATDATYVRAGKYSNQVMDFSADGFLRIKRESLSHIGDYTRSALIKFDISQLVKVGYAVLTVGTVNATAERTFNIYSVDPDAWDSKTATYSNVPQGTLLYQNVKFASITPIDLAPYINEALDKGATEFSIRIDAASVTESETTVSFAGASKPIIAVYPEKPEKGYIEDLYADDASNEELWAWAERMYDEWYARYQALPAVNENAEKIVTDKTQYTKINYASGQSTNYNSKRVQYNTRVLAAITDLDTYISDEFKNAVLDAYGGIKIESMKQKATGYFYSAKIDGRWWLIDPLGYPYISIGLSDIHYSQLGSKIQKENVLNAYGTYDAWALATTRRVRDELNFNSSARAVAEIRNVKDGLPFIVPGGVMSSYGSAKGVKGDGNGSTVFTENNTMPVFDPDFVGYTDAWAKTNIKYQGEARLIGYTSDNELPMNTDMLDRALSVNASREENYYTYACTWNWLRRITGKDNPTAADITDELRDLYRGFVWDRYYYVVANAVKKYDPDHMYMGTRFLTVSKDSQWVYRFSAQYLDCMTINWYSTWEPQTDSLYNIAKYGDMPFIVTEFYTKAGDSGLGNTSGAGWYVATQEDRADFYENFTLKLLQSPNCVGWQWFQYMDNDPLSGTGDKSSVDSNKGIFASDLKEYTVLTDRMKVLNGKVYQIIDYFANKD